MGNVIPWSQIHPSIKSEQPFVGVTMVDPQGKLCISELIHLDPETMGSPGEVAAAIIAAAQQAAALVASSYRGQRTSAPEVPAAVMGPRRTLRVLKGGVA